MEPNPEVSRLMESLNMLIDRGDEPGVPVSNQFQRLEASLQIIDGKLSDNGRKQDDAMANIKQLTDVLVCQGQLLAKMHQRQETTARDLDMITTEIKQARADTMTQLQMVMRAQVATTAQLQAARPIPQSAMPTSSGDYLGGFKYSASQRSIHSPVSAQLSPASSHPGEYIGGNQVALHMPAYGGAVTPHSADPAAAEARRAHSAVAVMTQQQQLTPQQQQALYHHIQKQQQQQQQVLLPQYSSVATQQHQYLQQQQLLAHVVGAQQKQQPQRMSYSLSPAPVMSNFLTSTTPDLSPVTSTPVKVEPAQIAPTQIQELTVAQQDLVNTPVTIVEQPPKHAPVAVVDIEDGSHLVATMAAAPTASAPIARTASASDVPAAPAASAPIATAAPPATTAKATALAPIPAKAPVAPAPTVATKPSPAKPSNVVKPSMMPVSLIKPLPPAAAQSIVKASVSSGVAPKSTATSKPLTISKPLAAAAPSPVAITSPSRLPVEDAATAAARAAIPQVLATKPLITKTTATSVPKRPEPNKQLSGNAAATTMARRIPNAPMTGPATNDKTLAHARKKSTQLSSSSQTSSSSMSMSEHDSVAPVRSNERELAKHRAKHLLDGELEKSGPGKTASGAVHPSRVSQMEASSRAHSSRQRSNSRSRRNRSRSHSGSRSRRYRSRSRSYSRSWRHREESRSLSRSLSTGRRSRRSPSQSKGGWNDAAKNVELSIKGQTKSRRDEPESERPPKFRAVSPRVNSVVMFSSDNDGSGSGSDVDDLIEKHVVRSSSPELGTGAKVAVIGIVGASSSKRSDSPGADISARLGARMPVYNDDVYAHRLGETGLSSMPTSQYLGGDYDHGRQFYGSQPARPTSWHRSTNAVCDGSGQEITSARMSTLLKPFCFMNLQMVPTAYRQIFGCHPIPSGVKVSDFNRMLTSLDGFCFWPLRIAGSDPKRPMYMNFLQRNDGELRDIRQDMYRRLALTTGSSPVVLGPLLCFYLITLACMRVDEMTGPILKQMFLRVTYKDLGSLRVVTENGIKRMSVGDLCAMAKDWIRNLCLFIARGSRMQDSLDMATKCYETYVNRYRATTGSNSLQIDPDGIIAREMLESNEEHSRMFLGIRANELSKLYVHLVCMINNEVDPNTRVYLKQVSESLQNLSG
ncbi:hypothetical protein GGI10_000235 [Coemansia sp. RSA 2530]|nr:hypothetical protein GGI10_000235 [Coemansia sp. RSA 2530]